MFVFSLAGTPWALFIHSLKLCARRKTRWKLWKCNSEWDAFLLSYWIWRRVYWTISWENFASNMKWYENLRCFFLTFTIVHRIVVQHTYNSSYLTLQLNSIKFRKCVFDLGQIIKWLANQYQNTKYVGYNSFECRISC